MLTFIIILSITLVAVIVSFILDKRKTVLGLQKGLKMFLNLLPPLLTILIIISILLALIPNTMLIAWLGEKAGGPGIFLAAIIGSIALIPGFIAFPLCGILLKNGATYAIIAVFITTLMMVGIMTLPLEKKYFGLKAAILRNALSFAGAIIIGLLIGLAGGIL